MMFPEGTRSETGEIGQFRDGAFRLAVECQVPIIPIVIDGTFKVLPKHARTIDFTKPIKIKVLPPISPDEYQNSTTKLRDHVHDLMESTLAEMRNPVASTTVMVP
jgi:1-acyl-sn-glycerol-3-phosphate acyltransferase